MVGGVEGSKSREQIWGPNTRSVCLECVAHLHVSMLQEAVILYLQLTRGLAAPMTALRNPNPKFEAPLAPSNLALQYSPALRPEFPRYILSLEYHPYPQTVLRVSSSRFKGNSYYSCGLKSLDKQQTVLMLLLKQFSRETRGMRGLMLLLKQALRMPIVLVVDVSFM